MTPRTLRTVRRIRRQAARLILTSAVLLTGATVAAPPASALESAGQVHSAAILLGKPTISGEAVVEGLLIAHAGTTIPSGTSLAYVWKAGTGEVATTSYYQPKPADVGKAITVRVTASKSGYTSASSTSNPTAAVVKGTFASNYTFPIKGSANVGSTLAMDYTSVDGVVYPKPTGGNFQWLRDGAPISGATSGSYELTSADLGKTMTLALTVTRDGFNNLTLTSSNAIGPVAGAVITLGKPTIHGSAVVDGLLVASAGTVTPTGTSLAYSWKAGTTVVATTSYYQPKPADVGKAITVRVTASKTGLTSVSSTSDPTTAVLKATFASNYSFGITGDGKVGRTLTLDPGSVSGVVTPKPTGTTYRWLRSGTPITGATGTSRRLTSADLGKTITFTVTLTRAGYNNLTITSSNAIGPIAAATG